MSCNIKQQLIKSKLTHQIVFIETKVKTLHITDQMHTVFFQ